MDSTQCLYVVTCQCCNRAPYKKLVDGIYPPNTTGYEPNLVPINEDRLGKYALKNSRVIPDIILYMCQTILQHLRKGKKGYVQVGITALQKVIDYCHSDITIIEKCVSELLQALFQRKDDIEYNKYALHILHTIVMYKQQEKDVDLSVVYMFETDILEASKYTNEDPLLMLTIRVMGIRCLYRYLCILSTHDRSLCIPYVIPVILSNLNKETFSKLNKDQTQISKYITQVRSQADRCWFEICSNVDVSTLNVFIAHFFAYLNTEHWSNLEFIENCLDTVFDAFSTFSIPMFLYLLQYIRIKEPTVFQVLNDETLSICFDVNAQDAQEKLKEDSRNQANDAHELSTEIDIYAMNAEEDANIMKCALYALTKQSTFTPSNIISSMDILLVIYIYMSIYNTEQKPLWSNLKELSTELIIKLAKRVSGSREYSEILKLIIQQIPTDTFDYSNYDLVPLLLTLTNMRHFDNLYMLPNELFKFILYNFKHTIPETRFMYMTIFDNLLQDNNSIYPLSRLNVNQLPYLYTSIYLTLMDSSITYAHFCVLLKILVGLLGTSLKDNLSLSLQLIFKIQAFFIQEMDKDFLNASALASTLCIYNEASTFMTLPSSSDPSLLSVNVPVQAHAHDEIVHTPTALMNYSLPLLDTVEEEDEDLKSNTQKFSTIDTINEDEEENEEDENNEENENHENNNESHLQNENTHENESTTILIDKHKLETDGEMNLETNDEISLDDSTTGEELNHSISSSIPQDAETHGDWEIRAATGYAALIHSFISYYLSALANTLESAEIKDCVNTITKYRQVAKWDLYSFDTLTIDSYNTNNDIKDEHEPTYSDSHMLFYNRTYIISCILRSPVYMQAQVPESYQNLLKEDFTPLKQVEDRLSIEVSRQSSASFNASCHSFHDTLSNNTSNNNNNNDDDMYSEDSEYHSTNNNKTESNTASFENICEQKQKNIDSKRKRKQNLLTSLSTISSSKSSNTISILPTKQFSMSSSSSITNSKEMIHIHSYDQKMDQNYDLHTLSLSETTLLPSSLDDPVTYNTQLHSVL